MANLASNMCPLWVRYSPSTFWVGPRAQDVIAGIEKLQQGSKPRRATVFPAALGRCFRNPKESIRRGFSRQGFQLKSRDAGMCVNLEQ